MVINEVALVLENLSVDLDDTLRDSPSKELDFKLCLITKAYSLKCMKNFSVNHWNKKSVKILSSLFQHTLMEEEGVIEGKERLEETVGKKAPRE